MSIPVLLNDKARLSVSKETLNLLLLSEQVHAFKRSAGWVMVGCQRVRGGTVPYPGVERRNHEMYTRKYWH